MFLHQLTLQLLTNP
jgi:phytochromobilin:ferredoxin oxidoreductase